jgi:hypothetical protein
MPLAFQEKAPRDHAGLLEHQDEHGRQTLGPGAGAARSSDAPTRPPVLGSNAGPFHFWPCEASLQNDPNSATPRMLTAKAINITVHHSAAVP